MPVSRSPATKVVVFQWPWGMPARSRLPFKARPRRRAILVAAPVSSMNTRRAGSRSSWPSNQVSGRLRTSGRSCSAAWAVLWDGPPLLLRRATLAEWPGARSGTMPIAVLGIDLGKNRCSVAGLDETGRVVLRRRLRRDGVVRLAASLPPCVMAMEACCGAHHLGRILRTHEPFTERAVHAPLDGAGAEPGTVAGVTLAEPIQHHGAREDHRRWVSDTLPANVRPGPVARLIDRVLIANVGRR